MARKSKTKTKKKADAGHSSEVVSEELDLLRENLAQALEEIRVLNETHVDADELDLLRDSLAQALQEIADLENTRTGLEQAAVGLRQEAADRHMLMAFTDSLERQCAALEKDRRLREAVLGAVLLEDAAELRDLRAGQDDAVSPGTGADLTARLEALRGELAGKDTVLAKQAALLAAAQADLATQAAQVDKLLARRDTKIDKLQATLKERDEALGQHKQQIEELLDELKRVYKSTSWKLTGPVRTVGRHLK